MLHLKAVIDVLLYNNIPLYCKIICNKISFNENMMIRVGCISVKEWPLLLREHMRIWANYQKTEVVWLFAFYN